MGGGGAKSAEIIKEIRKILGSTGKWKNTGDDGAVYNLGTDALQCVSTKPLPSPPLSTGE
ncbi:MAG: hypothetical protein ACD_7C00091G0004, partial [uncultured bacterium]